MQKLIMVILMIVTAVLLTACSFKLQTGVKDNASEQADNKLRIISESENEPEEKGTIYILANSPSQEGNDVIDSEWKRAYVEFLRGNHELDLSNYHSYILFYIDDDDIPEIFIGGGCYADGEIFLSFFNGDVSYVWLPLGSNYIEKGGLLLTQSGHMGETIIPT